MSYTSKGCRNILGNKNCLLIVLFILLFVSLLLQQNWRKSVELINKSFTGVQVCKDQEPRPSEIVKNSEHETVRGLKFDQKTNPFNFLLQKHFCEVSTVGCFSYFNKKNEKYLIESTSASMTKLDCFVFCSAKKAFYAALLNGDTCLCSLYDFKILADPRNVTLNCDVKCSGGQVDTCGGQKDIKVYKLKSCYENHHFPPSFENSRLIGCFNPMSYVNKHVYQTSSIMCLAHCSVQQKPLAVWNSDQLQCSCDHFRPKFDLTLRQSSCDATSMEVYRTLAENQLCETPTFLPKGSNVKRIGLISSPGSGNTWTRHLLEQATGIYTGSVYNDRAIFTAGYLGEKLPMNLNYSFIIKDHMTKNNMPQYKAAIFLVRNPYKSLISEFNRRNSAGKNQTGHADTSLFYTKGFEKYIPGPLGNWWNLMKFVSESKKPFHLLLYEDLTQNPVAEIKKVMEFLEKYSDFTPKNLKQRLWCMSENLMGSFKRKPKTLSKDPFTTEMKKKINSVIGNARETLKKVNERYTLPSYEVKV